LATFRSEQLAHQRAELTDERSGKACSATLYRTKAKLTGFENTRSTCGNADAFGQALVEVWQIEPEGLSL
jgi:hypothetical protein